MINIFINKRCTHDMLLLGGEWESLKSRRAVTRFDSQTFQHPKSGKQWVPKQKVEQKDSLRFFLPSFVTGTYKQSKKETQNHNAERGGGNQKKKKKEKKRKYDGN